jgi:hypothetical protein
LRTLSLLTISAGRPEARHIAGINNVSMIADTECFAHVVVGNQYADAALLQEADDFLDFQHGNRVDPGKWLVKQNEAWIGRQGTGDFDPPPLAAG